MLGTRLSDILNRERMGKREREEREREERKRERCARKEERKNKG